MVETYHVEMQQWNERAYRIVITIGSHLKGPTPEQWRVYIRELADMTSNLLTESNIRCFLFTSVHTVPRLWLSEYEDIPAKHGVNSAYWDNTWRKHAQNAAVRCLTEIMIRVSEKCSYLLWKSLKILPMELNG